MKSLHHLSFRSFTFSTMVNIAALSPAEKEDLVTSLATLILHDAGAEISVSRKS